jgi:cytoskeletal protein CcmA (bactofilin family)
MHTLDTKAWSRLGAVVFVVLLLTSGAVGVVAAQETRAGGVVTIGPQETYTGDLTVTAGTVVVQGTVDGDLTATAGSVLLANTGTVTGNLVTTSGSTTVEGTVGNNLAVVGGSVLVRDSAQIAGNFEAAAGAVDLRGAVDGDVRLAADEITVGPTAIVGGAIQYDASAFTREPGATVGGPVTQTDDVQFTLVPLFGFESGVNEPLAPAGTFILYGFLANLVLGAALLLVAPGFGRAVADVGTTRALTSGGVGILAIVGVPLAILLLFLTIVGIPLALASAVAFALVLWIAQVYGAFVAGTWFLSLVDRTSRWGALVLGLAIVAIFNAIPFGGFVNFVILLLGLGAFALTLYTTRRGGKGLADTGDDRPREGARTA